MTSQSSLNPDALEAGAKALYNEEPWQKSTYSVESHSWEEIQEEDRQAFREEAGTAVSAYLTVAQPVVNSVEELEALPPYSVLLDGLGTTWEKTAAGLPLPWASLHYTGNVKSSWLMHRSARFIVLFRPEVKP